MSFPSDNRDDKQATVTTLIQMPIGQRHFDIQLTRLQGSALGRIRSWETQWIRIIWCRHLWLEETDDRLQFSMFECQMVGKATNNFRWNWCDFRRAFLKSPFEAATRQGEEVLGANSCSWRPLRDMPLSQRCWHRVLAYNTGMHVKPTKHSHGLSQGPVAVKSSSNWM